MTQYVVVLASDPDRPLEVYSDGAEAGKVALTYNEAARAANDNARYRVVRIESAAPFVPKWHEREITRLTNGTYKPVPWAGESWVIHEHFAHVSNDDPSMLAYTPDDAYGGANRKLRTRPGRYLERFYGDTLTQDDIRQWCAKFTLENDTPYLLFAWDPDTIEYVYVNGPRSCMSNSADSYGSPCHPVRVYGAGDLAIAYTKRSGVITARALCFPDRKVYGRIYGDKERLEGLLRNAGFHEGSHGADWEGARLLQIDIEGGRFVAPYLDYPNEYVRCDGEYLIIGHNSDIQCRFTDGIAADPERYTCEHCGEMIDDEEGRSYVEGEWWCDDCYIRESWSCVDCNERFRDDPYLTTHYGRDICEDCSDGYTLCMCCEEYYHLDDLEYSCVLDDSVCYDCTNKYERTHCGQLADKVNDCDCGECAEARDEAGAFELSSDGTAQHDTTTIERFHPVTLKPTSPTINDWRQLSLCDYPYLMTS